MSHLVTRDFCAGNATWKAGHVAMEPPSVVAAPAVLSSTVNLPETVFEIRAVDERARNVVALITQLNDQLVLAKGIRRRKSGLLTGEEKRYMDETFHSTESAIRHVTTLVEPRHLPLDTSNGNANLRTKPTFTLRDGPRIQVTLTSLGIARQTLSTVVGFLFGKDGVETTSLMRSSSTESRQPPPSYEESISLMNQSETNAHQNINSLTLNGTNNSAASVPVVTAPSKGDTFPDIAQDKDKEQSRVEPTTGGLLEMHPRMSAMPSKAAAHTSGLGPVDPGGSAKPLDNVVPSPLPNDSPESTKLPLVTQAQSIHRQASSEQQQSNAIESSNGLPTTRANLPSQLQGRLRYLDIVKEDVTSTQAGSPPVAMPLESTTTMPEASQGSAEAPPRAPSETPTVVTPGTSQGISQAIPRENLSENYQVHTSDTPTNRGHPSIAKQPERAWTGASMAPPPLFHRALARNEDSPASSASQPNNNAVPGLRSVGSLDSEYPELVSDIPTQNEKLYIEHMPQAAPELFVQRSPESAPEVMDYMGQQTSSTVQSHESSRFGNRLRASSSTVSATEHSPVFPSNLWSTAAPAPAWDAAMTLRMGHRSRSRMSTEDFGRPATAQTSPSLGVRSLAFPAAQPGRPQTYPPQDVLAPGFASDPPSPPMSVASQPIDTRRFSEVGSARSVPLTNVSSATNPPTGRARSQQWRDAMYKRFENL